MRCATLAVLCAALLLATGCAVYDRRDAPWDPAANTGRSLLDQIPNETGALIDCAVDT